jgi:membrane-associated phospholipid phosphatase
MQVRLPSFIAERFDTKSSLGLSLTAGLVVAAGATWIFAALLDAVFDKATMVRWDLAMADQIHRTVTPLGTQIFGWITRVGSPNSMTWMTIVVCLLLLASKRFLLAIVWIATVAGGASLEIILKSVVHRTRPEYAGHYLASGSYSFPSGHATLSFLGVAMLLYTLIVTRRLNDRRIRIAFITFGSVWVLLVGISRVYLGVHFPSDVLGGYTIAAAWFTTCVTLTNIVSRRRPSGSITSS